jgi:hypothetical protein
MLKNLADSTAKNPMALLDLNETELLIIRQNMFSTFLI